MGLEIRVKLSEVRGVTPFTHRRHPPVVITMICVVVFRKHIRFGTDLSIPQPTQLNASSLRPYLKKLQKTTVNGGVFKYVFRPGLFAQILQKVKIAVIFDIVRNDY